MKFGTLLQYFTEPKSDAYINRSMTPDGPDHTRYTVDIDSWVQDHVKDASREDREFTRNQLKEYERERLKARRKAEKQWLERRYGRSPDD